MRTLFTVAVSLLALTSANSQPATTTPPERSTTLGSVQTEHPDWFTERGTYKPCPAFVVFPGERHVCLGLPVYPTARPLPSIGTRDIGGGGGISIRCRARREAADRRAWRLVACMRRAPRADIYYIDAFTIRASDVRDDVDPHALGYTLSALHPLVR